MIEACATVHARIRAALVQFTEASSHGGICIATAARAGVGVHALCARATVQARRGRTLVYVSLTDITGVAGNARALVCIGALALFARAPALARRRCTLIDVNLTIEARKSCAAHTSICENSVHTRRTVQARVRATFVQLHLAMRTSPAIRARALVRHHARRRRALAVGACRAVHARRRRAFLDVLARLASVVRLVARVAHALVGANADMDTLGVVLVTIVLRAGTVVHLVTAYAA